MRLYFRVFKDFIEAIDADADECTLIQLKLLTTNAFCSSFISDF